MGSIVQYSTKLNPIGFQNLVQVKIAYPYPLFYSTFCAGRTHLNFMLTEYGILEKNY